MLTVLGSAATAPTTEGAASSYLLHGRSGVVLVDAGPGSLLAFLATHRLDELRGIVVTHLHADHSLDLMAWAYRWTFPAVLPRIPLFVPAGEEHKIRAFDELFGIPTLPTMNHPIQQAWDVRPLPMDGVTPVTIDGVELTSFAAHHAVPSAALRARVPDGRIVTFSSDTGPCESLLAAARHADVFVCEATYLEASDAEISGHGHLTARLAGEIAQAARAAHLVLTHLSDPKDAEAALTDAAVRFHGPISVARAGLTVSADPAQP